MSYIIDPLRSEDWMAVRSIYEAGIATGQATFETVAPTWEVWDTAHRPDCRLVARQDGQVVGWAALSPVSGRCVYGGVAEVSVYVAPGQRGKGIGKALLQVLVAASESTGIWTLQASIFPENTASVQLHHACGFRLVGTRERLGQQYGRWRDVVLLERRSTVVGV
jgi:phosphinothricin acetyltransferase